VDYWLVEFGHSDAGKRAIRFGLGVAAKSDVATIAETAKLSRYGLVELLPNVRLQFGNCARNREPHQVAEYHTLFG
jgi:hypothetical protein